ncbi:MAG: hypothetical protein U0359_10685 [Byssovorax sp.]
MLLLLLSVSGCEWKISGTALFVRQVNRVAPGSCALPSASPSDEFVAEGVLDAKYTDAYAATLLVGRQVLSRRNPFAPEIVLHHVEITIADANGDPLLRDDGAPVVIEQDLKTTIPQSSALTFTPVDATLLKTKEIGPIVDAVHASGKPQLVISEVVLSGIGRDGSLLTTDVWEFPIEVCWGCLCQIPAEAIDPGGPPGNCDAGDTPTPPCRPGQDDLVDCRLVGRTCD